MQQNKCNSRNNTEQKILNQNNCPKRTPRTMLTVSANQGQMHSAQAGNRMPAVMLSQKNSGNAQYIIKPAETDAEQKGVQIKQRNGRLRNIHTDP